ncbi:TPA: G5 domain-containing protein, partial [Streptococcus pneumoniae]|nr:G5 domain-containing protein [Streptococcus pneumoniae]HEV3985897.1 G5 domain-containing protein [Streptococcus pneumoniae]HEV3989719.1 G5 domain-containing protein [Streptococcus pneumoniae]HEV3991528.1 G5 domain-containing protein [Streptococcus pneumoniae]HEV3993545.1 G5 domain-containing protein [Streptococcus pneumoniae]
MKHSHKKSFDWYSMQQRYSIRKYYFGAASVLLGTALVLGAAASVQTVQAEENKQETTNSISVGRGEAATKPAEVSASNKEKTYAAPTVANPVETTPVKTEEVTKPAEKVEEAKDKKEEVTHQDAVDKSKLLTALSRAKKLESKLYTEASAANLQTSIQAGQSLLGKADATEAELSAAESSIQSFIIGLELRSNSNKETVSETPVAKKADAVESKEGAKPAATTERSAVDSAILPTSTADKVETTSAPASINEILKLGLSLSDARQNPAIRKEDVNRGYSGFRAASNPANPIVSGSGNTVAFADISQGGRSYSFRGYGNSRGGNSIHYDVTTVRSGNSVNFTISYSAPGDSREFVNNNFILDKGDGFGNPSNATITSSNPRVREQSKSISQGANYVSHSGYSMTSAISTNTEQTIRFSLPIINLNGDLSVRLKPVTFNVDQGGGGAATSNDPYSNSNYYYRANPLYLDANPYGGTNNKTVSEDIDFQTVYLPTSKLPEGQTRLVREGEKGQRQITYKVHRFGNETLLGLPISNSVTKEAKPRIMQIGVAKDLIDTVKPRVDQNKVGDTNNLTFYLDNDGNGVYTEGVDELVQKIAIKDGAKGEKGDQGERGLTGAKGEKGDRGERGLTGAQGAKGEKGDRGERGLTGAQGAKGEKGDRGERGLTGAQGAKGEKGDRGERGLTGAQGAKGEKGAQGERGLTGAQGAKGEKGDQGERGLTGAQGAKGEKGDQGERGLTGAQGAKGEKGAQGERGLTGTQGAKGEKGDRGERGLTGAQGAKGEKGDRGERGLTGAQGAKGEKGAQGERGLTGAQGAKGEKGDQGERGLTGAQGEKGDRGERGLTGAKGEKGDQGERGITGAKGEKGAQGERGLTGAQGAKGEKGDQGERGLTGAQGEKGAQGQAGRDGVTPTVTVKDNKNDGTHTITINDGRGNVTSTVVRDGFDGASPLVATQRNDADKTTTVIFYYDKNGNNELDASDKKLKEVVIADGAKGEKGDKGEQGLQGRDGEQGPKGEDGKTPTVKVTDGQDGTHTITINDGKGGITTTVVRDGFDGASPLVSTHRNEADKTTTVIFYYDLNDNNQFDEGDTKLKEVVIADGKQGPKGDKGDNGKDGFTPEVTVTDNNNGTHTITITQPDNRPSLTTIVKNGEDGKTPKVKAERDDAKKQTTLTFYIDKDGDGSYTAGKDELVQTTVVKDGQDGAAGASGRDGKEVLNGKVDPTTEGKDGDTFVNTQTGDVFVKKGNTWEPAGNIKGPKGDKGADGAKGEKGAQGERGLTGAQGVKGEKGDQGERGLTGSKGEKGDQGERGLTGAQGAKGDKGEQGLQGRDGAQGPKGADGQRGPAGPQGPKGEQGNPGTPGKDGKSLIAVKNGVLVTITPVEGRPQTTFVEDGQKGADGKTPTVTITEGQNGTHTLTVHNPGSPDVTTTIRDGATGQAGRDGKDVLNGKVNPQPNQGKNGDKYINIETGDVYVKNNGNWDKEGNIKGPKGDKGADGAKGEKGDQGERGLTGAQGAKGADGAVGRDGRDGKDVLNGKANPEA